MESIEVHLKAIRYEAQGVSSYELRPMPGRRLPPFTAGAHIDVHLPNGLMRNYSLCNPQSEGHRYLFSVNKDPYSRGGSRFIHEQLHVGDLLTISAPRNNFPLNEQAAHTVLIAGGIGITPIWCMIQRLQELKRSWQLFYAARNRQSAAFLDELRILGDDVRSRLHFNFDQEAGGKLLNFEEVVAGFTPGTHLYCCGPLPMLEAFERATTSLPSECVHREYFAAKDSSDTSGGFEVQLAKTGRVFQIQAGKTILDTLLDEGVDVQFACGEGICGTCETRVLQGIPDHRDLVLSKEEQAANDRMMICCSGSKTDKLVLDL